MICDTIFGLLAAPLDRLPGLSVEPVEAKITFVSKDDALQDAVEKLRRKDVKALPYGPQRIRLVTHGGIDDDAVARTVEAFEKIAATQPSAS